VISTHVLDTARGGPAREVGFTLEYLVAGAGRWELLASAKTNADGRAPGLLAADHVMLAGTYRLTFDTGGYFAGMQVEGFYPKVEIVFVINEPTQHYHVPLLLSPFGYSTYRGS
jgi:5-hydroxyisourate hydrolase